MGKAIPVIIPNGNRDQSRCSTGEIRGFWMRVDGDREEEEEEDARSAETPKKKKRQQAELLRKVIEIDLKGIQIGGGATDRAFWGRAAEREPTAWIECRRAQVVKLI